MKRNLRTNKLPKSPQTVAFDTGSFESLYNQYVDKVYRKCLSFTKDSDTAQDFTQEIFIKVFKGMKAFENRSSFSTWLYSISHNYCLDQVRIGKRMNTESLSDRVIDMPAEEGLSGSVESQLQALEGVMRLLNHEEEALLRLKYEHDVPIKKIAQRYYLTKSAVKMRLKRIRD